VLDLTRDLSHLVVVCFFIQKRVIQKVLSAEEDSLFKQTSVTVHTIFSDSLVSLGEMILSKNLTYFINDFIGKFPTSVLTTTAVVMRSSKRIRSQCFVCFHLYN